MHLGRFTLALVLGSAPIGVLMAWAGQSSGQSSGFLLVLTMIPLGMWIVYLLIAGRLRKGRLTSSAASCTARPE
jgi:hypothetical protein